MAPEDVRRAVATRDLKHASCQDPPLQSASAHSTTDKGFKKRWKNPTVAVNIISSKFRNLLLMISPKPVCQHSYKCPPCLCWKQEQIWSEAAHQKQLLGTTAVACLHCSPKQGFGQSACSRDWKPLYVRAPWSLSDLKHLPPDPQLMYKPSERLCLLCRATAHGWEAASDDCSYVAQQRTFPPRYATAVLQCTAWW